MASEPTARYVMVVPDLPAVPRQFIYSVPDRFADRIEIGTQVRVDVHGRRVAGWVTEFHDRPPERVKALPLALVRGIGPPASVVDLARWSAWRWAGAFAFGLRTASSDRVVSLLPAPPRLDRRPEPVRPRGSGAESHDAASSAIVEEALASRDSVVRIGPSGDRLGIIAAYAALLWEDDGARKPAGGPSGVLVLAPTHAQSQQAALRLRRLGYPVALLPGDWAMARAGGCVVVGTMTAAFAPLPSIRAAVVLDAHDEAYVAEAAPTWCAWRVVEERARRDGAPLALVSPCPTLDVLHGRTLVTTDRVSERRAWPRIEVVDRRGDDPRTGLFSERVVSLVRWAASPSGSSVSRSDAGGRTPMRRAVCVFNRRGRARLLACASCRAIARCERCKGAVVQVQPRSATSGEPEAEDVSPPRQVLTCNRCGMERPFVCAECGSTRLAVLRPGVSRVREELEALAGTHVAEVTATAGDRAASSRKASDGETDVTEGARVVVGTEAVLHRVEAADVVIFLDFDHELLAPRMRAGEEALALISLACRLVARSARGGERPPGGPVVVQTRMPEHVAIKSAVHADPGLLSSEELDLRTELSLPPVTAMARITGASADTYVDSLHDSLRGSLPGSDRDSDRIAAFDGIEVTGPTGGEWRVVAPDHVALCDLLASVQRPSGRLRIEVDPVRI